MGTHEANMVSETLWVSAVKLLTCYSHHPTYYSGISEVIKEERNVTLNYPIGALNNCPGRDILKNKTKQTRGSNSIKTDLKKSLLSKYLLEQLSVLTKEASLYNRQQGNRRLTYEQCTKDNKFSDGEELSHKWMFHYTPPSQGLGNIIVERVERLWDPESGRPGTKQNLLNMRESLHSYTHSSYSCQHTSCTRSSQSTYNMDR